MPFPREFDLVAACCRWPPSAERQSAVREAAAGTIDWPFLLRIAERHRVQGLVHDGLSSAGVAPPAETARTLAGAAADIARENLAFAAEAHRLRRLSAEAGVDLLFVKGVTLNMLAYGTLALKRAIDIDVAVSPEDEIRALALLRAAGYECLEPGREASDEEIVAWTARHKHSAWLRGRLMVELHSSLVDSPGMLQGVSPASPRQEVPVTGGLTLPTLATEPLFAYLCVHGATHGWARLKWLADVNALVASLGPEALERLYRSSVDLGGGRAPGQALLLCSALFGLALPPVLERALRRDRGTRHLVRTALDSMVRGGADTELGGQVMGTAAIHLSHLRLRRGFRFKLSEVGRKLGSVGGGPLLAIPRWLLRRARQSRGR